MRELRQYASRYLLKVKAGETVEITDRGQLVALLVPPGVAVSARDRLVRAGRLTPATSSFDLPVLRYRPVGAPSTDEALGEVREARLR